MSVKKKAEPSSLTLSYSSAQLLNGCTQKYWHYKVAATPKDPDFTEDFKAFAIGKAFHSCLEQSKHEITSITPRMVKEIADLHKVDSFLLYAMVLKYFDLNDRVGTKAIQVEFEVKTSQFLGFVDAIMTTPDGKWWIVDLKTAARFDDITLASLQSDTQLNLYSFFAKDFAEQYRLKMEDFGGARYRVVTKATLVRKVTETSVDYVDRIKHSIKAFDCVVPASILKPEEAMKRHEEAWKLANALHAGKVKPQKNFKFCNSFFRQCEYWSKCHQGTFTESKEMIQVTEV